MSAAAPHILDLQTARDAGDVDNSPAHCRHRLRQVPVDAEALRTTECACNLAPYNPRAWSDRGCVHVLLGDWREAVTDFSHALRIDANCVDAWHHLGVALCTLGHHMGAFIAFKNALRLNASRAPTYLALGNLLFETGQLDDALECFEKAIAYDSSLAKTPPDPESA